jgi:hypothetical protein
MSLTPIFIDCKNLRFERQNLNNKIVFNAINNNDLKSFNNNINQQELKRLLKDTKLTLEELFKECNNNHLINKLVSRQISINSSRQGCKDEEIQINICSIFAKNYGIIIDKLDINAFRPTKDGKIISKKELKNLNISLDNCLKSFDAKISGKLNGWIFAKIVYGTGGHQDNVFEEADNLCNWINKYRNNYNEIYVFLIDTDLNFKFEILKNKYLINKNIIITNHYDFQNFIKDNYKF